MKISRRNFLSAVPVAGAAIMSAAHVAASQTATSDLYTARDPGSLMSFATFARVINTEFTFWSKASRGTTVVLESVDSSLPASERRNGRENFVLRFAGFSEESMRQDLYTVVHPTLGKFDLFITEGAYETDAGKKNYIAVINNVTS